METVSLTAYTSFIDLKDSAADAALLAGMKMAEGYAPPQAGGPGYEVAVHEFPLRRHVARDNRALSAKKDALASGSELKSRVFQQQLGCAS